MTFSSRSIWTAILILVVALGPGLSVAACAQLCTCECTASHLELSNAPADHEHEAPCSEDSCSKCARCLGVGVVFALPAEAALLAPPGFSLPVTFSHPSPRSVALCDIFQPPRI